jgi:hypothetical protein
MLRRPRVIQAVGAPVAVQFRGGRAPDGPLAGVGGDRAEFGQQNPDGSQLAVVVLDGPGASEFLGNLATSDHAFDTWFRTNVEDIHPMDFSAPPPVPVRFL